MILIASGQKIANPCSDVMHQENSYQPTFSVDQLNPIIMTFRDLKTSPYFKVL